MRLAKEMKVLLEWNLKLDLRVKWGRFPREAFKGNTQAPWNTTPFTIIV